MQTMSSLCQTLCTCVCVCVCVCVLDLLLHHVVCHVICSTAIESAAYTINALGNRVNLTRHEHAAADAGRDEDNDDDDGDGDGGGGGGDELRFNTAVVTSADLMATDGVVHIVNQVFVPNDGLYCTSVTIYNIASYKVNMSSQVPFRFLLLCFRPNE